MFEGILDSNEPRMFGHIASKKHLGTLMKLVHAERVGDEKLVLVAVGLSRLQVDEITQERPHVVSFPSFVQNTLPFLKRLYRHPSILARAKASCLRIHQ
jgi:hypothetical protein